MGTAWIHSTALVETDTVGEDTSVWAFAHIMNGAVIGANCNIGDHVFIESGAKVGNGVTVKNNVLIWKGVQIADYVFVGPNVVFTNDLRPRSSRMPTMRKKALAEPDWLVETVVEEGASIGANATILPGVSLGRYCMIGAGSVVTKDVPPFALVAGNPARAIGKVDEEGNRVA